jgi:hypothetical protein
VVFLDALRSDLDGREAPTPGHRLAKVSGWSLSDDQKVLCAEMVEVLSDFGDGGIARDCHHQAPVRLAAAISVCGRGDDQ